MLDLSSMAALALYEKAVERLTRLRPSAWHLVVAADDKCRAEHIERIRRSCEEESCANGFNKTNHYINSERPCTTTLKMKKKLSICEFLSCLDLVIFLVLNGIKPHAPLRVVPFRQSFHVLRLATILLSEPKNCDFSQVSACDHTALGTQKL